MAGGLFALLDDIAALARLAAASTDDVAAAATKASAKAVGVVVDDTAVTPRYVQGLAAERELPIIKKIAIGSLRNKLLIILPVAMLLSQFLPLAVTLLLMLGGAYLSFEGAEKVWHAIKHRGESHAVGSDDDHNPATFDDGESANNVNEDEVVRGAVRTDLILSSEIMVIALKSVAHEPFISRALILVIVAILITVLVYGIVALIVKMDDLGLRMIESGRPGSVKFGHRLVNAMPKVMSVLSTVGVVAMMWVGGHILLVGLDELGFHAPYHFVHSIEHHIVEATGAFGSTLGWLFNTLCSAIFGLIVGSLIVPIVSAIHRIRGGHGVDEAAAAH